MIQPLYLAWRYLCFHRFKTAILVISITLIIYLPIGLRVLVAQSSEQLTSRADVTPLVIGAKGSPVELVLNTLYFGSDSPEPMRYAEVFEVNSSQLAEAIPMYVRFHSRGYPIVGTSFDYFPFRGLRIQSGRNLAMLGECVLGAHVAEALSVGPGDYVVSSPKHVFDFAGVYPLKMRAAGVLEFSDSPDDSAIFVDIKTAWIIEGLGHGHQDLTAPEAAGAVLSREKDKVTANASVVQYNEITADNADSLHFHGDLSEYPITAVIAVPPDQKSAAILLGRFQSRDGGVHMVRSVNVIDQLLDTIFTVESYVVAGAVVVGLATLVLAALVFML